jgi:hypothetical protein
LPFQNLVRLTILLLSCTQFFFTPTPEICFARKNHECTSFFQPLKTN